MSVRQNPLSPREDLTRAAVRRSRVIVFLKAPRAGFVKTRLAATVGEAEALRIYRWLVERQLEAIPSDWSVEIAFTPADAGNEMQRWLGPRHHYHDQGEGDLGERLARRVAANFQGGADNVIVIGGDCAALLEPGLRAAEEALDRGSVVLGPAIDGGYYLVGLRRPFPRLFEEIDWSSPAVLAQTLARCSESGEVPILLPTLEDIDDFQSWRRYEARRDLKPNFAAPLTIIVPALNEAEHLGATLASVRLPFPTARVIVADGVSSDGTAQLALAEGAEVVIAGRGRGLQCQAGARMAAASSTSLPGDSWLLFLHADTLLPENAVAVVSAFTSKAGAQIATFRLRFDRADWFLRASSWLTRFDSVFTRFGDQGILVRRSFYDAIGGFPAWPLFEDVALLQKARRETRIHSLPAAVTTSARRFHQRGALSQQWLNTRLLCLYLAGVAPATLAARYRQQRSSKPTQLAGETQAR